MPILNKNHKKSFFFLLLVVAGLCVAALSVVPPEATSVNVTQHHNNPSRDGLFIDPAFTLAAAANVTRDLSFNGTIVGNVYAQPLYIEDGPGGAAMVIAVTESNNVYALNATTGAHHLATQRRHAHNVRSPVRQHQSAWHYRHAGRGPCLALAFLRRGDQAGSEHLIYLLERRHGRHQRRLAGGCECCGIGV